MTTSSSDGGTARADAGPRPGAPAGGAHTAVHRDESADGRHLPRGVVFDCDGTIADTETLSERAWIEALDRHGYRATPQDFGAVIGHPFPQNWEYFSQRVDLGDREVFRARLRARFRDLFDRELEVYRDAVDTIRALSRAGVPIAVASSSSHQHVERVLERARVQHAVRAVVGADDVDRTKPHPEPYLRAATALGLDPVSCTAVEDTAVGVASARGAGMFTVGVIRHHGSSAVLRDAHRVVGELTIGRLRVDGITQRASMG